MVKYIMKIQLHRRVNRKTVQSLAMDFHETCSCAKLARYRTANYIISLRLGNRRMRPKTARSFDHVAETTKSGLNHDFGS